MKQIVVFNLDSTKYCLYVNEINEILDFSGASKLPDANEYIEGIINLRGKIFAVVNLKKILGIPLSEINEENKIIILNNDQFNVGILIDSVSEIFKINENDVAKIDQANKKYDSKYLDEVIQSEIGNIFHLRLDSLIKIPETV